MLGTARSRGRGTIWAVKARSRGSAALAGALLLFGLAWDGLRPVASYDAWFHVQTGRALAREGVPLEVDLFSHTFEGSPWPWQDWLADLLMAGFAVLGDGGLVLFKFLGFVALMVALGWGLRRGVPEAPPTLRLGVLSVAAGALSFRVLERPELLSLVIAAVFVGVLDAWRDELRAADDAATPDRRWRWPSVALGLVLLNAQLHRGALLLPVLLAVFALCVWLEGGRSRRSLGPAWMVVPAGLALLCTPYGLAIFDTSRALLNDYASMREFETPAVEILWRLSPWTVGLVLPTLAALWVFVRRGVRAHLWELACLMMGLVLVSRGLRYGAYLPILATIPALRAWPSSRSGGLLFAQTGGLLFALGWAWFAWNRPLPGPHLGVAADHHPVVGIEFIGVERAAGHLRGPVLNASAYGGYLLERFDGEVPVYVDGRVDLVYSPEFMERSAQAMVDPRVFEAEAERWGIEWVLIDNDPRRSGEAHFDMNPRWGLVHVSARALVYVRKDGVNGQLWETRGYRLLRPHFIAQSVEAGLADGGTRDATVREVLRMYAEDPENRVAQVARARLIQAELIP